MFLRSLQDGRNFDKLGVKLMQTISIPIKEKIEPVSIKVGEHLTGEFIGDKNGASILVFGSVHGNQS
jgi:hypothetical protein